VDALARDLRDGLRLQENLDQASTLWESVSAGFEAQMAEGTAQNMKYAWRFWVSFCQHWGTSPFRSDATANAGLCPHGSATEAYLQLAFVVWSYQSMSPRSRSAPAPDPKSAWRRLYYVRKKHAMHHMHMLPLKTLGQLMQGLLRTHARLYPGSLVPTRAESFSCSVLDELVKLAPSDPVAGHHLGEGTLLGDSFRCMVCFDTWGGFRLVELTDPGYFWSDLSLVVGGKHVQATPDNWRRLRSGDFVAVRPRPSKCDPFGIHFSPHPVYFQYDSSEVTNAAAALARLVARHPPSSVDEPLFRERPGVGISYTLANRLLRPMLGRIEGVVPENHSWHSFRSTLATRLLGAGVPDAEIQRLLRWRSADSLKIYARLGPAEYAALAARAAAQDATAVQARNLPRTDWTTDCLGRLVRSFDEGGGVGEAADAIDEADP
jgi:hypothetical protein